jgi:hypothetical protein
VPPACGSCLPTWWRERRPACSRRSHAVWPRGVRPQKPGQPGPGPAVAGPVRRLWPDCRATGGCVSGRGEPIERPNPWLVRAADRQAYQGWQQILTAAKDNLDRAWVAITADPRHIDQRRPARTVPRPDRFRPAPATAAIRLRSGYASSRCPRWSLVVPATRSFHRSSPKRPRAASRTAASSCFAAEDTRQRCSTRAACRRYVPSSTNRTRQLVTRNDN